MDDIDGPEDDTIAAGGGSASDDEVLDALPPIGSHISLLGGGTHGTVRSLSPHGTRMLLHVTNDDGSQAELWLGTDDAWEIMDDGGIELPATADVSDAAANTGSSNHAQMAAEDGNDPLATAPILHMWRWTADGAVSGHVYGKRGFRDGELMTTSVVPPEGRFDTYVITGSGSAYRLGERAGGGSKTRRSSRAVGKESLLDAFGDATHSIPDAPEYEFLVGGADAGGATAERIMRGAFSVLDDNLVMLRAQYATARRVVLLWQGTPVASSVVEVHTSTPQSVLEVPILAAARTQRIQGHGSILVAILKDLGSQLGLRLMIVSATQESMRFWLRQGLHTPAHCQGAMRAALRKIDQSARRGFANSISMAMELPARQGSASVSRVLRRLHRRASKSARALTPSDAPGALGYTDVNAVGNFFLQPDGRKRPVTYSAAERLAVNVPYNKLEAFPVSARRGWGVRCTVPITQGQVVVEVRGRCLSEVEYEELHDPSYVVSFDDKLLQLKRAAQDDVMYIDLREYGNMMRLINDCHEAPNLQLMYWPELDVARGILPRRAFLVAKHDIPPSVELTWDYGRHYERHWLSARHGTGAGWARSALLADADGASSEDGDDSAQAAAAAAAAAAVPMATSGKAAHVTDVVTAMDEEAAEEEAARAEVLDEVREQLLSAEELLPWEALDSAWGSTRHDWLQRVQRAMEALDLAEPLMELAGAVQEWALGETWPQQRDAWLRSLERVAEQESLDPEGDVSAQLKLLLHCLQPAFAGEMQTPQANPFKERLQEMRRAPSDDANGGFKAVSEIAVASVACADGAALEDASSLELLPASSVVLRSEVATGEGEGEEAVVEFACEASSEDEDEVEDEDEGEDSEVSSRKEGAERYPIDVASLPTEAQGWKLQLSKRSPTGYTGVVRKGAEFALRRSQKYNITELRTYPTAVEAAVEYAKLTAALAQERGKLADVWLSPAGGEHVVAFDNLAKFCAKHHLKRGAMVNVRKGTQSHHKGWRLSKRGEGGEAADTKVPAALPTQTAVPMPLAQQRIDAGLPLPAVGEQIEVEVDEDGVTSWRPAEVRQLLRGRKFTACVDEDEGFVEVYTMVEEGVEWRRTLHLAETAGDGDVLPTTAADAGGAAEEEAGGSPGLEGGRPGGRVRKAPQRLSATEDPRHRPLWYRKQLLAQKAQEMTANPPKAQSRPKVQSSNKARETPPPPTDNGEVAAVVDAPGEGSVRKPKRTRSMIAAQRQLKAAEQNERRSRSGDESDASRAGGEDGIQDEEEEEEPVSASSRARQYSLRDRRRRSVTYAEEEEEEEEEAEDGDQDEEAEYQEGAPLGSGMDDDGAAADAFGAVLPEGNDELATLAGEDGMIDPSAILNDWVDDVTTLIAGATAESRGTSSRYRIKRKERAPTAVAVPPLPQASAEEAPASEGSPNKAARPNLGASGGDAATRSAGDDANGEAQHGRDRPKGSRSRGRRRRRGRSRSRSMSPSCGYDDGHGSHSPSRGHSRSPDRSPRHGYSRSPNARGRYSSWDRRAPPFGSNDDGGGSSHLPAWRRDYPQDHPSVLPPPPPPSAAPRAPPPPLPSSAAPHETMIREQTAGGGVKYTPCVDLDKDQSSFPPNSSSTVAAAVPPPPHPPPPPRAPSSAWVRVKKETDYQSQQQAKLSRLQAFLGAPTGATQPGAASASGKFRPWRRTSEPSEMAAVPPMVPMHQAQAPTPHHVSPREWQGPSGGVYPSAAAEPSLRATPPPQPPVASSLPAARPPPASGPPVPPRFRMELLKLLAHRRAPLQLDCILPEHGRFVKLPRPLEPQELGCTTLGYGNGDGFTYLLKNMADCISILPGPPGVESTPDRPNLQIVLKGSEHLATASQPQAPWRQTSSTSTPVASASAAAAPPPQLTLRQQLSQSVMQSAAVPPSSHAPAAPLPPAFLIKSESLESTDSGPQMVRLGSWLTRGKHPTSALMEYAQHQKQQQRSPTVDWTVHFTFDETGAAGNGAQSQPMTCTAHAGGRTASAKASDKKTAKSIASQHLLQLLCPEYAAIAPPLHVAGPTSPASAPSPSNSSAALPPAARPPAAAATLRPNEMGALRDLLNAAQRKPDGQHAPNAWTSADNVATEFASGRTTDAVGPSAPGTTGVVPGFGHPPPAAPSPRPMPSAQQQLTSRLPPPHQHQQPHQQWKAPRPTGTPLRPPMPPAPPQPISQVQPPPRAMPPPPLPPFGHSQQQSLSALPPPHQPLRPHPYAPITANPPAAMRPPVAQQQQQLWQQQQQQQQQAAKQTQWQLQQQNALKYAMAERQQQQQQQQYHHQQQLQPHAPPRWRAPPSQQINMAAPRMVPPFVPPVHNNPHASAMRPTMNAQIPWRPMGNQRPPPPVPRPVPPQFVPHAAPRFPAPAVTPVAHATPPAPFADDDEPEEGEIRE